MNHQVREDVTRMKFLGKALLKVLSLIVAFA